MNTWPVHSGRALRVSPPGSVVLSAGGSAGAVAVGEGDRLGVTVGVAVGDGSAVCLGVTVAVDPAASGADVGLTVAMGFASVARVGIGDGVWVTDGITVDVGVA